MGTFLLTLLFCTSVLSGKVQIDVHDLTKKGNEGDVLVEITPSAHVS